MDTVLFAGGCFWCTEHAFLDVEGVVSVTSGYAGGVVDDPSYEQVCSGNTGHRECVEVVFDSSVVSFSALLSMFWSSIDPFDCEGQFFDRGFQYSPAVFCDESLHELFVSSRPAGSCVPVFPHTKFWRAEESHQRFCRKNPIRYAAYASARKL